MTLFLVTIISRKKLLKVSAEFVFVNFRVAQCDTKNRYPDFVYLVK
jgi:hypothetical protein